MSDNSIGTDEESECPPILQSVKGGERLAEMAREGVVGPVAPRLRDGVSPLGEQFRAVNLTYGNVAKFAEAVTEIVLAKFAEVDDGAVCGNFIRLPFPAWLHERWHSEVAQTLVEWLNEDDIPAWFMTCNAGDANGLCGIVAGQYADSITARRWYEITGLDEKAVHSESLMDDDGDVDTGAVLRAVLRTVTNALKASEQGSIRVLNTPEFVAAWAESVGTTPTPNASVVNSRIVTSQQRI